MGNIVWTALMGEYKEMLISVLVGAYWVFDITRISSRKSQPLSALSRMDAWEVLDPELFRKLENVRRMCEGNWWCDKFGHRVVHLKREAFLLDICRRCGVWGLFKERKGLS